MMLSTTERVSAHTADAVNRQIGRETEKRVAHFAAHPDEIGSRLHELDREWDVERTLEANASTLAFTGVVLGATVDKRWLALPALVTAFVTPGYAGVRSPKWLASVTIQDKPSDNHIQQKEYKLFPPGVTKQTADLGKGVVINDMPLNSAILEPMAGARLALGSNTVRGYAIATGRPIVRVDVSADGGKNWHQAELERHADAPWSWTFWNVKLELPRSGVELVVRAVDDAGETQPSATAEIWNYPGYLSAAWHRVPVSVS